MEVKEYVYVWLLRETVWIQNRLGNIFNCVVVVHSEYVKSTLLKFKFIAPKENYNRLAGEIASMLPKNIRTIQIHYVKLEFINRCGNKFMTYSRSQRSSPSNICWSSHRGRSGFARRCPPCTAPAARTRYYLHKDPLLESHTVREVRLPWCWHSGKNQKTWNIDSHSSTHDTVLFIKPNIS